MKATSIRNLSVIPILLLLILFAFKETAKAKFLSDTSAHSKRILIAKGPSTLENEVARIVKDSLV